MDRRIKKTNTAIFEAYIQAKRNHPEIEPSVKEVCAIADINKTTFYRYFTDIEALSYSIMDTIANKLLIEDIEIEKLLTEPEVYFKHVLAKFEKYKEHLQPIIDNNAFKFLFEAENIIKSKLKETTNKKYDEVLLIFISGGSARYFFSANYKDEAELQKFCRIIRAITSAML